MTIVCALTGLSNAMGDRHAGEFKSAAHQAAPVVNTAMTFSNCICDTYVYQRPKGAMVKF